METRRDFLKGTAWMGAMAFAAGCLSKEGTCAAPGGAMCGFVAPALKKVRVGVVGLGHRGSGAVHRLAMIPGVTVAALCDFRQEKIDAQVKWLKDNKKPEARQFTGPEGWKRMCEWDGIDVVYNVTNWANHAPIALYAMKAGKHVFIEVPAAMTLDECWELVETSEATKRHCMQLENCCYGEEEMLGYNLVRKGLLGEIVHGECAYIHDLRASCYRPEAEGGYWKLWRLEWNTAHKGNQYTTHGLGPIAQYMDINRGDRFDYLVSLESKQANCEAYAKAAFGANSPQAARRVQMGDMNTTLIKTALGRSIMLQHDVSSPRPYTRHNLVTGTKGIFYGMPWRTYGKTPSMMRLGFEDPAKPGSGVHQFLDEQETKRYREEYRHPLWKKAGDIAKKVGGHGGMDFLMDLRWAYCLQNGMPLDMNVYDLAAWCSVAELSERSVRSGSMPQKVPDFTRGAWKTAKPLGLVDVDLEKLGLDASGVKKDSSALNV